jgi:hypothetical protein
LLSPPKPLPLAEIMLEAERQRHSEASRNNEENTTSWEGRRGWHTVDIRDPCSILCQPSEETAESLRR